MRPRYRADLQCGLRVPSLVAASEEHMEEPEEKHPGPWPALGGNHPMEHGHLHAPGCTYVNVKWASEVHHPGGEGSLGQEAEVFSAGLGVRCRWGAV